MPPDQTRRALITATLGAPLAAMPLWSARADADRPVTAEEYRQIEATLRREGFSRWGKVEFDGGRFEVEDAVNADGEKYDLKISNVDFSIMSRERED